MTPIWPCVTNKGRFLLLTIYYRLRVFLPTTFLGALMLLLLFYRLVIPMFHMPLPCSCSSVLHRTTNASSLIILQTMIRYV